MPKRILEKDRCVSEGIQNPFKINPSEKKETYYGYTKEFGGYFILKAPHIEILPTGIYNIEYNRNKDADGLVSRPVITDDLFMLPDNNFDDIMKDVKMFWDSEEVYKKFRYVYKRGILLYGKPGNGKSALIDLLCHELITKHNGIIIFIRNSGELRQYIDFIQKFRVLEPKRRIINIIEDIDGIVDSSDKTEISLLLNLLDGCQQTDNVVTISTTNKPEVLEDKITKRPSRFDRVFEIKNPDVKVREYYLTKKFELKNGSAKGIDFDLNKWVKETDGFSLDQLKELFLSVYILKYPFKDALDRIKDMISRHILKNTDSSKQLGFGN